VTLDLGFIESQILLQSLKTIWQNYQVNPREMDDATSAVWYSRRGCESAGMSNEEATDWVDNLHQAKLGNLELLERWIRALSRKKEGGCRVRIKIDEASSFLSVLNDHRLLVAARNGIGEAEMDVELIDRLKSLPPNQQTALLEMDLIGAVMEEVMRKLSSSAL